MVFFYVIDSVPWLEYAISYGVFNILKEKKN